MKSNIGSWKTKSLADLLDVQNGYAFDSDLFDSEKGMPLIRIRDLKGGESTVVRYKGTYDERFVVRSGDLLIGMDGEFRCYQWAGADSLLNQRVCRLIDFDTDQIIPEFVLYGINRHLKEIEDATPYVTVKHLSSKKIKEIKFAFPPLPEQRRIVARIKECMERVEEVESLRSETNKESDALLESLIEAEFQSTAGDEVVLEEVCGITSELVDPRKPGFIDSLHVGGANIESETGRLIDLKTSREEKLKSAKFPFDSSMVLYNKIRPYLKKVARPDFSGICSADMYPLSPNPTKLDKDYLFFLLLSRNFTRYAIEGSNRAGMPKVNRRHLFAYRFNLPHLDQQQQIAERLNEALTTLEIMRAEYLSIQTDESHLRDTILRKAFAGEL